MRAHDYLESLRAEHRFFSSLAEIAFPTYPSSEDSPEPADSGDRSLAPATKKRVKQVLNKYGRSLSAAQQEAVWRHVERLEANKSSDLEWPHTIHQRFIASVSDEARQEILEKKDIAVGLLRDARFRGSALKVPEADNGWVIALYEGLSLIIYGFALTLASSVAMRPDGGGEETTASLTKDAAAMSLYNMLRNQIFTGVPIQDSWPVTDPHGYLAGRLTEMAESFLYAHEMAHILLGHDVTSPTRDITMGGSTATELAARAEEETEADVLGWMLMVRNLVPKDGSLSDGDLQMAYAGPRLFLRIAQLLERAGQVSAAGTHPVTADRLTHIRMAAEQIANEFEVPFSTMAELDEWVQTAMTDLERRLPPLPWRSPVDELLEGVAAKSGQSFTAINAQGDAVRQLLHLLSFGAPRKLCRALGRAMGSAILELRKLGIDVEAESAVGPLPTATVAAARAPFAVFWVIAALETAYLPQEISRLIERSRDEYLEEQEHVA
jgi:hypothetical protein